MLTRAKHTLTKLVERTQQATPRILNVLPAFFSGTSSATAKTAPIASFVFNTFAALGRGLTATWSYAHLTSRTDALSHEMAQARQFKISRLIEFWTQFKTINPSEQKQDDSSNTFSQRERDIQKLAHDITKNLPQDPTSEATQITKTAKRWQIGLAIAALSASAVPHFFRQPPAEGDAWGAENWSYALPFLYLVTQTITHDVFSERLKRLVASCEQALGKLKQLESGPAFELEFNRWVQTARDAVSERVLAVQRLKDQNKEKLESLKKRATELTERLQAIQPTSDEVPTINIDLTQIQEQITRFKKEEDELLQEGENLKNLDKSFQRIIL